MEELPFRVGYCLNCSKQTMVHHPNFGPVVPKTGTRICWICLCDGGMNIVTRMGTITLCDSCNPAFMDISSIDRMIAKLVDADQVIFSQSELDLPNKKIEQVKVFGD